MSPSSPERPVVQYVRLGKSGLRVSVPIFGTMSIGSSKTQPWIINDEEAIPLLKYAWERGINTFDTANVYSNGESERIIGRFLTEYHIPREQILIFTKCFGLVVEHDISLQAWYNPQLLDEQRYVNQSGLSRTAIFHQVDKSLQRLQTSYIDLLQIHRFDPETPIEETMKALHDLVQSGKVRYLGASSMRAWQFAEMNHVAEKNGWTQFVSMQDEYSLLYREEEREMIPYCKAHGIGIIPWGPLAAGILARPFSAPSDDVSTSRPEPATARERFLSKTIFAPAYTLEDKTIIKRVEEIAHKKGWTMAQVALTWTMGNVTSPIVGISKNERLDEAIITGKLLSEDERDYLERPYIPKKIKGHA